MEEKKEEEPKAAPKSEEAASPTEQAATGTEAAPTSGPTAENTEASPTEKTRRRSTFHGLFRGPSKAMRVKKDKEAAHPTVEEGAKPTTESKEAAPAAGAKAEEVSTTAEPSHTAGDAPPDVIPVGQTPQPISSTA